MISCITIIFFFYYPDVWEEKDVSLIEYMFLTDEMMKLVSISSSLSRSSFQEKPSK